MVDPLLALSYTTQWNNPYYHSATVLSLHVKLKGNHTNLYVLVDPVQVELDFGEDRRNSFKATSYAPADQSDHFNPTLGVGDHQGPAGIPLLDQKSALEVVQVALSAVGIILIIRRATQTLPFS